MIVKNSTDEIRKRIDSGQINRTFTILAVLVRPALFIGFQGLMVLLLIILKYKTPALTATSWWTVYGTPVGFGWSLQHSFLPFINLKYAVFAFLLFFPLTIILQLIYLHEKQIQVSCKQRRLVLFILKIF